MEFGLYLHLPYCRSLCPYCAFAKAPLHHAEPERLLAGLAREWDLALAESPRAWGTKRPRTLYFGGGTPTALDLATLRRLFAWLSYAFDLSGVREWTVEANPEGLSPEKLALLRAAGVDRLSLGVQSLEPAALKALGRIHTAEAALDAIALAKSAGFRSISVDLMTAVPGETAAGFRRAVETMASLGVRHLSIYSLQVEEGTPLHAKVSRGAISPPGEEVAAERYEEGARIAAAAGYRHYEVSNFALPGHESRHNEGYWTRRPYLALGPGAHSFDGRRRWGNEEDVTRYYECLEGGSLPRRDVTELAFEDAVAETVMLGLRRARGIRLRPLSRLAPGAVATWTRWAGDSGALAPGPPGRARPSEHGLRTVHEIAAELLTRIEAERRSRAA